MSVSQSRGQPTDVPLESFFGPDLRPQSPENERLGRAMMHHFHHVAEPLLQQSNRPDDQIRIPKLLHMIWLGHSDMPNPQCQLSWRQFHPDWELRVWTNADLENHDWTNRDVLNYAMSKELYGLASDILRLEVLWKFGGLYVDVDYMCVARLDDMHRSLNFYIGASCTGMVEVNNGLVASQLQHPLLAQLMDEIHTWWRDRQATFGQVAAFLGPEAAGLALATQVSAQEILVQTGPGLLTRTLGKYFLASDTEEEIDRVAVLPFTFFHPMPNTERGNSEAWENYVRQDETRAVHLWRCSWQTS